MSKRAEQLATRLEQGVRELRALAEGLTDAEWMTPVKDGRTIGVVVDHVANVYPIEIQLAQSIAAGKAVEGVTWDDVHALNAQHARDKARTTKAETLAFLDKNSRDAAAAVRKFTDAELDTAAAFSLAYGAPMTAQFVLEDHAVRHAFHHLHRIKLTLNR